MHEILVINCLHDAEREICALLDWKAEVETKFTELENKVRALEAELSELRRQKKDQESLALGQQPDHKSGSCSAIIEVN